MVINIMSLLPVFIVRNVIFPKSKAHIIIGLSTEFLTIRKNNIRAQHIVIYKPISVFCFLCLQFISQFMNLLKVNMKQSTNEPRIISI